MSSNLQIKKVCAWCEKPFVAKTTTTKYCSHICNSRAYKAQKKKEKIQQHTNLNIFDISEQSYDYLNSKEYLKVKEVSTLLGLCRQTIYNLIYTGQLKASKISPRITLIKRSDIDEMFAQANSKQIDPIQLVKKEMEFYSFSEIKEKFNIGDTWTYKLIKENDIPKVKRKGKSYYSKSHIDNHLKGKNLSSQIEIDDWATIKELCNELHMKESGIYSLVSREGIPKKREGRNMLYSRKHILISKGLQKESSPQFYSIEEAMLKFNLSRDSLYSIIKKHSISKLKAGKYIKVSKTELDKLLNPQI
ncbi:helix-turn-helix domain-containing protein [Labilibaculum antarcticum]|uniref:DNA-binding protein n=1 Tax=Labilibaculum antarcticum TaxID=1717717 RepID=A0A1Y1CQS5_9BACT|nr:helix-turn-helix domain-containing protein [Labilibaculum antarcticum]BAX82343.1 DNA-binding protein [Labilibaculum antarcticum]